MSKAAVSVQGLTKAFPAGSALRTLLETMRQAMAPEDELCLLLARRQLAPEGERRARELLAQPLRWDAILERARTHDVLPLIYHFGSVLIVPQRINT